MALNVSFPRVQGFFDRLFRDADQACHAPTFTELLSLLSDWKYERRNLSSGIGGVSDTFTALECRKMLTYVSHILHPGGNFDVNNIDTVKFEKPLTCFKELKLEEGLAQMDLVKKLFEPSNFELSNVCTLATYIIINAVTKTVDNHIILGKRFINLVDVGCWVTADAPARIDLAGGWTDTPPICWDFGGKVCGVSVQVDGKRPIGAKSRRIEDLLIKFALIDQGEVGETLELREFKDVLGFDQPNSKGALLKAAMVYSKILDVKEIENIGLRTFLEKNYGSGIEIQSWSNLPKGSGLGTSSILAGCVLATLWTIMGYEFKRSDLVHGTLMVEQILTTGGGWQDQVNGLLPGIKLGRSIPASKDVQVCSEFLDTESHQDFYNNFQKHVVLVFTGDIRLAKNLLQDVLLQWHIGCEKIMAAMVENHDLGQKAWDACQNEDIEKIGSILLQYWNIKKLLAKGAETETSQLISETCKHLLHGWSLCGAGGGGFMVLITKKPNQKEVIETILGKNQTHVSYHDVIIDTKGINLSINQHSLQIS